MPGVKREKVAEGRGGGRHDRLLQAAYALGSHLVKWASAGFRKRSAAGSEEGDMIRSVTFSDPRSERMSGCCVNGW